MLSVQYQSSLKRNMTKVLFATFALVVAFLGVAATLPAAQAAPAVTYTEVPFTQTEISTNWTPDRTIPSGGYPSVTFGGRSNVLEMSIVGADRSTADPFYYTEGIQRQLTGDPTAIKADLFVDSAWLIPDTDVRAGLWGVAKDSSDEITAYPIVEFTTAGEGNFTGWRSWDGVLGGWTNLPSVSYNQNSWNKLEVVYNSGTNMFDIYINNVLAVSSTADTSVKIGAVILNSYNYGTVDEVSQDYQVRWSNFAYGKALASPQSKDACKNNGWAAFGFRNQGLCIQYANTGKDSR